MRHVIDKWLLHNNDTYLIVADFGKFPLMEQTERFINVGLSETLLVNTAIGLSLSGKHVYIYSAASFVLFRAFEQIKLHINGNTSRSSKHINITILNGGSGFCYYSCGMGHYLTEDILLVNNHFNNFNIYFPYDELSTINILNLSKCGLNYIRLAPDDSPFNIKLHKDNNFYVLTIGWLVNKMITLGIPNVIPLLNFNQIYNYESINFCCVIDNVKIQSIANIKSCLNYKYIDNIINNYDYMSNNINDVRRFYKFDDESLIQFYNDSLKNNN